ncbi:MAG: type II toxin-antitoxin system Phd/YefM family antitoxin [Sporichthyaceae bacterium]
MKTASITEAKNGLSALIDLVKSGETVVITDRGVPVARLESAVSASTSIASDEARVSRLERAGVIKRPTRNLDSATIERILAAPPPRTPGTPSVLEHLLSERREGR